ARHGLHRHGGGSDTARTKLIAAVRYDRAPAGRLADLGSAEERRHRNPEEDGDPDGPPGQSPADAAEMQSATTIDSYASESEDHANEDRPRAVKARICSQVIPRAAGAEYARAERPRLKRVPSLAHPARRAMPAGAR